MTKIQLLILLAFLLIFNTKNHAQFIDNIAVDNIIIADSLFDLENYNDAISFYDKAEKRNFFPRYKIFEKISLSYYLLGKNDYALKYMKKSIDNGKRYRISSIINNDTIILKILSRDSSNNYLQQLIANTDKFVNSYQNALYKEISDSLSYRKKLDQKYRIVGKTETKEDWKKQKAIDYSNRIYLTAIIDSIGVWPGYKEVGVEGESGAYLFVQHSEDSVFQSECLILMHQAVLLNNMHIGHYGLLVDRCLLITKGYQVYGTQIEMVEKEGKKIAQPKKNNLLNNRYVNVLRYYFEMPPLEYYLNQMTEMNTKK